jgi:Calx-beta domain/Glycosyl hydrolases family 18
MDSVALGRVGSAVFAVGLGLAVVTNPVVALADSQDSESGTQSTNSSSSKSAAAGPERPGTGVNSSRQSRASKKSAAAGGNRADSHPAATVSAQHARPAAIPPGVLRHVAPAPTQSGGGLPATPVDFVTAVAALVRREFEKAADQSVPAGPAKAVMATAAATPAGTTTTITWGWGTNPVVKFAPATDKLDFGWMQATSFDVSEKAGSTVISIVDNNHTYTLSGVAVSQLQTGNIVAKDAGTVAKWQNIISTAQTTAVPPTVSVGNASVNEGNSGSSNLAFTVALSKASTKPVTVKYVTANGTAIAGQDYQAGSGTVTFAPGVTSQVITVGVTGDSTVEANETLTVILSTPTGATLGTATATGTIVNDDVVATPPAVSIGNASANEGAGGTSNMAFTVTLSKASTTAVTVKYVTANGTAIAGQDYQAASGTMTFAPGVTSQVITVGVTGDSTVEANETLTVTLSTPTGATLGTATATGTIVNDDVATLPPSGTTAQWGNAFFAPYVDMAGWPVPNLLGMSKATGATLMTLGFLQVDPNGKPAWGGLAVLEPGSTDVQAKAINDSIASFRAAGGDVMISFGGQAGTSLAEYYAAKGLGAQALANTYKGVIDTYGIDHVDFDIEGAAISNRAAVDLNNQALKLLQQDRPQVKVWYTLPVLPTGLTADGVYVVESAVKAGVNVAGVNVMAMDYGESAAPTTGPNAQTMGTYAIRSAQSTYNQLSSVYTKYGKTFAWSQIGVTAMLGVNDIQSEVFTVADAQALEDFARSKGIGMLSIWSLERDNPGTLGQASHNTSGLSSPAGAFSKVYNDYGSVNAVRYPSGGSSTGGSGGGTAIQGGTTTTMGWHWGTSTVLNFDVTKDKLDFVWMQPGNFEVTQKNGSTVITIVDNNQTYTLNGVTLSKVQIGNISALDANTLAKWQTVIANAKAV